MNRSEALLFAAQRVDRPWVEEFSQELATGPQWLEECRATVERCYAANPEAHDGFSRIGYGLAQTGRCAEGVEWYERDWKLDRMARWQFQRYVEALLALDREEEAEHRVEDYYRRHAEARDGWAAVAWHFQQRQDFMAACERYNRDHAEGRLTPGCHLRLAEAEANRGNWDAAESRILEAYAADQNLRDGFAKLGWIKNKEGDREAAMALLEKDRSTGRIGAAALLNYACLRAPDALAQAKEFVREAYAVDAGLRDGYARVGATLAQSKLVPSVLPFFELDQREGRLSPAWSARAVRYWSAETCRAAKIGELLAGLQKWLPDERVADLGRSLLECDATSIVLRDFIRAWLCEGDRLQLRGATLEVADLNSLAVMLEEVLVFENYYFETSNSRPMIIDAGANFGLATYYFRASHPGATILAIEPDPNMAAMLRRNVERNLWKNVVVVEAAIACRPGKGVFHSIPEESMAGSLTRRMILRGRGHRDFEVECRTMSEFLDRSVEFLKLDIEGSEREVLEECAARLHHVQNIFCEYHRIPGKGFEDLEAILRVLESAGFQVELAGPSRLSRSASRGIENVREARSLQLWATRVREYGTSPITT